MSHKRAKQGRQRERFININSGRSSGNEQFDVVVAQTADKCVANLLGEFERQCDTGVSATIRAHALVRFSAEGAGEPAVLVVEMRLIPPQNVAVDDFLQRYHQDRANSIRPTEN